MKDTTHNRQADLYRMVMEDHLCPYGLKAKDLLEREGFEVADHPLRSREETDAFKKQHDVKTTPQIFIAGERIGGLDGLREYLGKGAKGEDETTYTPVVALFGMAFAMSLAIAWHFTGSLLTFQIIGWFVAISMCLLALQKLRDVESFSTMFLNYDLLARRWVRYGYIYPFAEGLAGVLMLAGAFIWLAAPIALIVGTIGAVSVIKAVYIDKRELKCACMGGNSDVPLGFVSLTENLMMAGMGLWMLARMATG
ncbi:glutaredoxin [Sulfitobacter sp. LCG007]